LNLRALLVNLNLANQLTFLRLVAIPFFILAILESRFELAFVLFVGAALTDLLDGFTARILKQQTPLGAFLDPVADKLLLTSAFILLTDYPSMFKSIQLVERIPIWLTIMTISRDVLIVCVVLILFLTFHRKSFRPSFWGKLTAVAEDVTIAAYLAANWFGRSHPALRVMVWLTLSLTLVSGFHYLARTIRMLREAGPPRDAESLGS
jgi:cardiolipin synthase